MSARILVREFARANPIYRGASVSFYTVAGGVKTATLATLYSAKSGSAVLTNPVTLDSRGKAANPIYIEDAVIATVSGISVPSHDTGIFDPQDTLVVGTDVQAFDALLEVLAGLTMAADRFPYFTSASAGALATLTTFMRTVLDDADAATARTTLGAVGLTGSETVAGAKTFSSIPVLSGGGIKFPATQVPSSDANTLDDYEKGTFTPNWVTTTGTPTYSSRVGSYVKIGQQVFVELTIILTNKGTGVLTGLSGLPFAAGHTANFDMRFGAITSSLVALHGHVSFAGTTTVALYVLTAAATGYSTAALADFANTSDIGLNGVYHV